MSSFVLLFPGQGSQYVGMGKSFLAQKKCKEIFDEAESVLSFPISKIMFDGSMEELTDTSIAQPAILLHSMVAFHGLKEHYNFECVSALGHSLGEYSALVAAGVLTLSDAIKIVHLRGRLMQEAVPRGVGAMAAVLGMDAQSIVTALLEFSDETQDDYASCANFNGPQQTVIAGTKLGVLKASQKLKSLGAKRIVDLPVSAPFHCAMMKPVQEKMRDALMKTNFHAPRFPIISNVSAQKETKSERIKELLIAQVASPVRFTDCINCVSTNETFFDGYLELGPKTTLSGIVKKIEGARSIRNVDSLDDISQFQNT